MYRTILAALWLPFAAVALEGQLPADVQQKNDGSKYNISFKNVPAEKLAQEINGWGVVKATVDAELVGTVVPEFEHKNSTPLAILEDLAKKLGAKAVVQNGGVVLTRKGPAPAAGDKPNAPPKDNEPAVPAAPTAFEWAANNNMSSARWARRPVALLITDGMAKPDQPAMKYYNDTFFTDAGVRQALASFTNIKIDSKSALWPKDLAATAKGGASLYLLTCDGTVVSSFPNGKGFAPVKGFDTFAQQALKANEAVAALIQKEEEKRRAAEKAADGEKDKPDPNKPPLVPGLAGGKDGEKTKEEPKKTKDGGLADEK